MLDFNTSHPLGISITLCSSLDERNQISIFDGPHALHGAHEPAQHEHGGLTHYDHNEDTSLSGHSCGVWSPNAVFAQGIDFNPDNLLVLGSDQVQVDYLSPNVKEPHQHRHQARAPPVSSII
jgi:hypothetical protein